MPREIWAVFRHEMRLVRCQPGMWVFLILGLLTLNLAAFYLGDMLVRNRASLEALFVYVPWLFLFFAPAFAMGAWAEEWRRGTAERLLTLPLRPAAVTLGKYFALLALLALLLLGTWPLVATIAYLGSPDWGPLLAGYGGAFLFGALLLAVGFWASALSVSQAGAASLAFVVGFALVASGWGLFTGMVGEASPALANALVRFSLLEKYRHLFEGLVDARDIVLFLSLTAFFVLLAHLALLRRLGRGRWHRLGALATLGFVLVINGALASTVHRVDLTAEHLHSLAPGSKNLLGNLPEPLEVTLYYSAANPLVPPATQRYARRVEDFIAAMAVHSAQDLHLTRVDPTGSLEREMAAVKAGIQPKPLDETGAENYYLGLKMRLGDREVGIPAMSEARAGYLEFDMISLVSELMRTRLPRVGILTELDLGNERVRPRFMSELMANYDVEILSRNEPKFPENLDLVIVFMTPFLGEMGVYALEQYMLSGGKAFLFVDPYMRTAPTPDYTVPDRKAESAPGGPAVEIDHPADLLRAWGVDYDYSRLVADVANAGSVNVEGFGISSYPLWFSVGEGGINRGQPFTTYLPDMFLVESGFFSLKDFVPGLEYEKVLTTSPYTGLVPRYKFDTATPANMVEQIEGDPAPRDVSVLLRGRFPAVFPTMPANVRQYYRDFAPDPQNVIFPEHLNEPRAAGALLAIADMDFLTDDYALSVNGGRLSPANGNLIFVYNAIQYLLGDRDVLSLRSKGQVPRTFTRIEAMLAEASARSIKLERELTTELVNVTGRLGALQKRAEQEQAANLDLQQEILNYHRKQLELKKQLRGLQIDLRADIQKLGRALTLTNLLLMPVILALLGGWLFRRRRKKSDACASGS